MSASRFPGIETLAFTIERESAIRAPIDKTFAALLDMLGPANETADGLVRPLILEPWPGGRWFRDLGDGDGHFWAVVQAIKRPVLLELRGPLFMSYPADNDLQFRIEELDGKTTIRFRQSSFGLIPDEHKGIMIVGSEYLLKRIGERAEASHTT